MTEPRWKQIRARLLSNRDGKEPERAVPPASATGMLDVGSPEFRAVCAISVDGVYFFVPDRNDARVAEEIQDLGRRYEMPPVRRRRAATLAEIAHLNGRRSAGASGTPPTAGARRMLDTIGQAAALRASDLKLIIRSDFAVLRLRLGAEEYTHGSYWAPEEAAEAIAWLYDRRDYGDGAPAQQAGQHQPFSIGQERRIDLPTGLAALRAQKAPHGDGHDFIVLRLIYTEDGTHAGRIEDLGLEDDVLEALEAERRSGSGLVIIGGSTGDGKSTTLVRQLERLYQERDGGVSIMTVEDPVEYPISGDGIVQMPVEGAAEGDARRAAFTRVLKTFVRSNPDVGMISEIRTADDCREIMQFVISGHKVFTTIHSYSAAAVLFRLISLGVEPKELAEPGVISLVMRQQLVPILCPDCSVEATGADLEAIRAWIGDPEATPRIRHRKGCPVCLLGRESITARQAWGGLSRKRATAEVICPDDAYRRFVQARDAHGALAHWLAPRSEGGLGGISVETRLRRLVASGETDFTDVTRQRLPSQAVVDEAEPDGADPAGDGGASDDLALANLGEPVA